MGAGLMPHGGFMDWVEIATAQASVDVLRWEIGWPEQVLEITNHSQQRLHVIAGNKKLCLRIPRITSNGCLNSSATCGLRWLGI